MRRTIAVFATAVTLLVVLFFAMRPDPDPTTTVISAEAHSGDAYAAAVKKDSATHKPPTGVVAKAKAKARGVEQRQAEQVIVYDTIDAHAEFSIEYGRDRIADIMTTAQDSAGVTRPVKMKGVDLSECDDGVAIRGTSVLCNEPRFGHLDLYARAGAVVGVPPPFRLRSDSLAVPAFDGAVGATWRRRDRSTFSVEAELRTNLTVYLGGRIQLRAW